MIKIRTDIYEENINASHNESTQRHLLQTKRLLCSKELYPRCSREVPREMRCTRLELIMKSSRKEIHLTTNQGDRLEAYSKEMNTCREVPQIR